MRGIRGLLLVFVVISSIFFVVAFDSNSNPGTNWKMLGLYNNRTGWDGVNYPIISGLYNMSYTTGAAVRSSAVVVNGYVYIGSDDDKLYQLNASNVNQVIATYTASSNVQSSPVIVDGYVYVGDTGGDFYQLNASNVSQLISSYTLSIGYFASSPAVVNGYVYVGSSDKNVYQLNASNVSHIIANYSTGDWVTSSPAVAGGYVYVGSKDNKLYQLNASNISQIISSYTGTSDYLSSPAVANDYVYIAAQSSRIQQLNASNVSQLVAEYLTGDSIESSPAVVGDYLYCGTSASIYQLNASNVSQFITSYSSGNQFKTVPAVANGYVYLGNFDSNFYQLNASNVSQLVASYNTGSLVLASAAVTDDYVYFGGFNSKVYQLSASNISLLSESIPPVISAVSSSVTTSSAIISWTTDENATSVVYYGLNSSLGLEESLGVLTSSHSVELTGLNASTLYYYNVSSCDGIGNCNNSVQYSFTTSAEPLPEPDSEEPVVSSSSPSVDVGLVDSTSGEGVDLSYGTKLEFNVDDSGYDLYLRNIDRSNNVATFEIIGFGEVEVMLGDSVSLDIDLDGVDDVVINLNDIDPNKVAANIELSLVEKIIDSTDEVVRDEVIDNDQQIDLSEGFFDKLSNWFKSERIPGSISPGGSAFFDLGFENVNDVIGQEITVDYKIINGNDTILHSGIEIVYAGEDFTGEFELIIPKDLDEGNYTIKIESLAANGLKGIVKQSLVIEEEPKLAKGPLVVIGILVVVMILVLYNMSRRGERGSIFK